MGDGGATFDAISGFVAQLQGLLPYIVDNGDGTGSPTGQSPIVDNGDGTATMPDILSGTTLSMFDNNDGTVMSLAGLLQNFRTAFGKSYSQTLTQNVTDQVYQAVKGGSSVNNPLTSIRTSLQGIPAGCVISTALDAAGSGGGGVTAFSSTTLSWQHSIAATSNYLIAAVTGYFSSGGYSNWTRNVSIANTAVTFDAVGGGVPNGAHGATPQTWSHTVSSAPNTVVIVGINQYQGSGTFTAPSAVTFGGQSMTGMWNGNADNNVSTPPTGFTLLYVLLNPNNTGTQTVSVTAESGATYWANSVSYTNVSGFGIGADQGGFWGTAGSSTNPTLTSGVPSSTGHIVVSVVGTLNKAVSSPAGTSRYSQSGTSTINSGFIMDQPGSALVTPSCTAATAAWAITAVDLVPVGAAMTSLGVQNCGNTLSEGWVELFGLANPPTGLCSVNVYEYNPSSSSSFLFLVGDSVSYNGIGSVGTAVTNSGTATTVTTGAVPSATGRLVVAALGAYDKTLSAPSGTVRYGPIPATATTDFVTLYITDAAGAATVTQTCTVGTSPDWATVAVDLR